MTPEEAAEHERRAIIKWLRGLGYRIDCPADKSQLYRDIAMDIAVDCAGLKAIREGRV